MKIAVINETSAADRNADIVAALEGRGHEILNVGMKKGGEQPELQYIQTGLLTGLLLHLKRVDLVVGGCGTGQGFLISSMQYPNVYCGLIVDPTDAFLFSQINAGNCVSLPMNKGYGWAGELNMAYIFEKLFIKEPGSGYPPERAEFQNMSRNLLKSVNEATHKTFEQTLLTIDKSIIQTALAHKPFMNALGRGEPGLLQKLFGELF